MEGKMFDTALCEDDINRNIVKKNTVFSFKN